MIPDDAPTWSLERTREEIASRLPKGWRFLFGSTSEGHHAFFLDESGEKVWESWSPAANLALFDAFAFLSFRGPSKKVSAWTRRQETTLERVKVDAARLADPLDLDPDEVASVYRGAQKKV